MPPKKTASVVDGDDAAAPAKSMEKDKAKQTRATIVPKNPDQWRVLLNKAEREHWRTLRVTCQIREKLMAGKPASLDVAQKMLAARGLEDQMTALPEDPAGRAEKAQEVILEGLCEFHRRPGKLGPGGKEGLWYPTNHLKAGLKENWSVMGYRNAIRGSRGALAEGLFVYSVQPKGAPPEEKDWIWLGEAPHGIHDAIAHTMSPSGPIHALKRHEYMERITFQFEVKVCTEVLEKIPDENFASVLVHFQEHGMGACRSQGFGKWNCLEIADVVDHGETELRSVAAGGAR